MRTLGLIILTVAFVTAPLIGRADTLSPNPIGSLAADSLNSDSTRMTDATGGVDSSAAGASTRTGDEAFEYPMSPERHAKLVAYSRFNNIWRFVNFFVTIGVLAIILFTGMAARFRDWASKIRPRFFGLWLFVILFLAADYLLNLPFSIYRSYFVEAQYGFMNQTFMQWWGEDLGNLLITMIFVILPVWPLYWLLGRVKRWWLYFSLGMIPIMVLAVVIVPIFIQPLFNDYTPLTDKQLEGQILALADKAGIDGARVFEVDASKQSSKLNAYVTGLFGSKRIVLYDTLIKNFSHDEIRFVMGHEMGHYVKHHIWWGLGITVLFIMFALWLTDKTIHPIIRRFRNRFGFAILSDWASLPLIMIFVTVIMFVFQPITNGYSRYQERVCDLYGMKIAGIDGETAARAFDKLSVYNLSDPDPAPLVEFWFYDHPALKKRMEYVRAQKF